MAPILILCVFLVPGLGLACTRHPAVGALVMHAAAFAFITLPGATAALVAAALQLWCMLVSIRLNRRGAL